MKYLSLVLVLTMVFVFSGCAATTGQVKTDEDPAVSRQVKEMQAKIDAVTRELVRQREENAALKKQIDDLNKQQVRMPTAKEIQIALKNAGYFKGAIDGQIGSQTKEAIKKFQEANKITADGVVGSRTWSVLFKYLDKPIEEAK